MSNIAVLELITANQSLGAYGESAQMTSITRVRGGPGGAAERLLHDGSKEITTYQFPRAL